MPRFNMMLEEQLSDSRSSEAAFRVKIENLGAVPMEVRRISPRIPEGVLLVEVKDSSSEATRSRHKKICEELTELLDEHIFESSKAARDARLQIEKSFLTEMVSDMNTLWRLYFNMFIGKQMKRFKERREQLAAQKLIIASKQDADVAIRQWFDTQSDQTLFGQMFKAKYSQLVAIEDALGNGLEASALATIEPDSFFATTYVLRFPRASLNPAKFSFSVEAALAEADSPKEMLGSTTTTVEISARPYILTVISILCALLGVAVKFSIEKANNMAIEEFFTQLGTVLATGQGLSAAVLALVLFNIYEHVEFGERLKMRIGWRSAMVVGVVSGLFSERVIAALKTLAGA
jgi:hypothetical protein